MEPKSRDSFDRRWWRCKAFFLAGIAVGAVRLAVLGVPPVVDASSPLWFQAVSRVLDVALRIPQVGFVVCWIAMLLDSKKLPASNRRGLLVLTALFMSFRLGEMLPEDTPAILFGSLMLANVALMGLMLWYMAKSAGEETQRQIDLKLGIKRLKPEGIDDFAPTV